MFINHAFKQRIGWHRKHVKKLLSKLNVITPHIGYPEKLPETYNKKIIDENLSLG